jgi:hypothetical protein
MAEFLEICWWVLSISLEAHTAMLFRVKSNNRDEGMHILDSGDRIEAECPLLPMPYPLLRLAPA